LVFFNLSVEGRPAELMVWPSRPSTYHIFLRSILLGLLYKEKILGPRASSGALGGNPLGTIFNAGIKPPAFLLKKRFPSPSLFPIKWRDFCFLVLKKTKRPSTIRGDSNFSI